MVLFGFTGITPCLLAAWRDSLVVMARDVSGFSSVSYDDEGAIELLMAKLYAEGTGRSVLLASRTAMSPPESVATRLMRPFAASTI